MKYTKGSAVKIGNKTVGKGHPCYFIAEAGVNHNGSLDLAKQLVDAAFAARADAVKFQKRTIEDILTREALDMPYTSPTALAPTYGEHRKRLELSQKDFLSLAKYAKTKGITFLASGWDAKSVDFIDSLGVPAFKTASADLTNLPLMEHTAKKGKPMIVSTGMSTMDEVSEALEVIKKYNQQVILLHCVSNYPCESLEVNLKVMETLRDKFDVPVGYSGHEKSGWAVTLAAVTMGAVLIERHFTLDRTLPGPDHAASLDTLGLSRLIANIHDMETAFGSPEKRISDAEAAVRKRLAKSIVAACEIKKGARIQPEMLTVKGPGSGLKAKYLPSLYGKVAKHTIKADSLLPLEALDW
jgi:N,N'-diacetyllegionaminate synthase